MCGSICGHAPRSLWPARSMHLAPPARAQVALAALADEAFALHFLEDSFAAGHMAGTWGKAAVRKGTHDYYNARGLETVTWSGHRFVAQGDAYMQPQDAERAATAVRDSLAQLTAALDGKVDTDAVVDASEETEPDAFDICQQLHFPALAGTVAEIRALLPIIVQTPVPALGPGPGELPRFHAELGPFVGVSAALRGVALAGGFGATQTGMSTTGGLEGAVRVGLGLEGVLNEAGDGLVFAEAGLRQDASTLGAATVPGRGALTARLRVPFWLLPGDLVLVAPVLALSAPQTLEKMAVQAANGGLIPWQAGIATPLGRFQFVLGREVGLSLYRSRRDDPMRIEMPGVGPSNATFVSLRSLQVELPILDRPSFPFVRAGSEFQSAGAVLCWIRHAAPVLRRLPGGRLEAGAADDRARGHPGGVRLAILPPIAVETTETQASSTPRLCP